VRQLGVVALVLASALATAMMTRAVSAIDEYGTEIGVAAYRGTTFLGLTWASFGVMVLATVASLVEWTLRIAKTGKRLWQVDKDLIC
jgi:hypothetical protein